MSSFTWQTVPGQLPPSVVCVPYAGNTYLADWNGPNVYAWDGTTLTTSEIPGASGFCDGILTSSGVSILSHEGIVATFTAPGVYTTVQKPVGNIYTGIASDGTVCDSNGNLYYTNGTSTATQGANGPFKGIVLYGTDYVVKGYDVLWSWNGTAWSSLAAAPPGSGGYFYSSIAVATGGNLVGGACQFVQTDNTYAGAYMATYVPGPPEHILYLADTEDLNWLISPYTGTPYTLTLADTPNSMATSLTSTMAVASCTGGSVYVFTSDFSQYPANPGSIWSATQLIGPITSFSGGQAIQGDYALIATSSSIVPITNVNGTWTVETAVTGVSPTSIYEFSDGINAWIGDSNVNGITYLIRSVNGWITNGSTVLGYAPTALVADAQNGESLIWATNGNTLVGLSVSDTFSGTPKFTVPVTSAADGVNVQNATAFGIQNVPNSISGSTISNIQETQYAPPFILVQESSGPSIFMHNVGGGLAKQVLIGYIGIYNGTSWTWSTGVLNARMDSLVAAGADMWGLTTDNRAINNSTGEIVSLTPPSPMVSTVPIGLSGGYWNGSELILTGSLVGGLVSVTP
jgi:hypothetical protein